MIYPKTLSRPTGLGFSGRKKIYFAQKWFPEWEIFFALYDGVDGASLAILAKNRASWAISPGPQLERLVRWQKTKQGGFLVFYVGFQTVQVPGSISSASQRMGCPKFWAKTRFSRCLFLCGDHQNENLTFAEAIARARRTVDPGYPYPNCSL